MGHKSQIWHFEGSLAEILAASLGAKYEVRAVKREAKALAEAVARNVADGTAAVLLDDGVMPLAAELFAEPNLFRVIRVLGATPANAGPQTNVAATASAAPATATNHAFLYLSAAPPAAALDSAVRAAFENIELAGRERKAREALATAERQREQLNEIGVALSSQSQLDLLLNMILAKAREITGADAGSLYLVEEDADGQHRQLRFKLTQNDSLDFPFKEVTLPLSEESMAGYTALRGEVLNFENAYKIPFDLPFHFNDHFDEQTGYHTQSLLSLPMRNAKGEVLGVVQLINSKANPTARIRNAGDAADYVQPFGKRAVDLALSLASQAAVAYENRKLYTEIETLFDGFVNASVTAIEQRDPTTSGHSQRVAIYTEELAKTVGGLTSGTYAGVHFDDAQLKEIRYAALLHDFGKVGVREEVLVKAKKLYPLQLELLKQRFDYIRKEIEATSVRRKLQVYLERDRGNALAEVARLTEDYDQRIKRIDEYFQFILESNEPTLLEGGKFDKLREIAKQYYVDQSGMERPYLSQDEVKMLLIPKGSLDQAERLQIESHVVHTFNFLKQIPWTKGLQNIPGIARAHHEKLDGTGYPYKLQASEIPLPAKMMTICDIYDALTAADRPYKRAVPVERALAILGDCAKNGEVDGELLKIFVDAKVYERTKEYAGPTAAK